MSKSTCLFLECIEPITGTIFGGIAAMAGSAIFYNSFDMLKDNTYCKYAECCNSYSIPYDIKKLYTSLTHHVYGQHLVLDTVVPAIQGHISSSSPKKPLTLSFHGTPGSGKNYVSQFIANSLYRYGEKSKFVHSYNGGLHFPLQSKVDEYKEKLVSDIKSAVKACDKSLFIFDEVDKMPVGVLDALKPFLDYNAHIDGLDFRKSIFIFLSNKGTKEITFHLIKLWNDGLEREKTKLSHFEPLVIKGAFEEEGGFKYSSNIKSGLIDHYIPFFPLERRHVEMCIKDEFLNLGIISPQEEYIEEVLSFVTYGPDDKPIFSKTGCKRISQKVAAIVTREKMNKD
ncbi:torsin-1A-like isoform X2 [Ctenocephalides felis]|uniref:torsin-1A-like isoform X2 n=1 Tax=Ctenocephalides felis TaxID=7515 RepID=UPI000E6E5B34|nr:torsin-1A-like isoform X2 [Ctenocephalides felis]XP_026481122.1 torsin-1A-like isoform X2 [Ctenocephalides felis]